ncbi:(2Fe-2S)-binding protein [Oceanicella sp. SM1341]|uniref:(2Fe-2S)-binding protein n=1 Tax=Oceanicella sp. SM1341 TaxID=1548889 RepID=UPI000E4D660D|nr:(2Fe-2S)-binding protein [Oceanicella sp. SM1341]
MAFTRLAETGRPPVAFTVDGIAAEGCEGDTVMVALLTARGHLRREEFGGTPRAGFCMMGACQDCWVRLADGSRIRACTTPLSPGMDIRIDTPEDTWPTLA